MKHFSQQGHIIAFEFCLLKIICMHFFENLGTNRISKMYFLSFQKEKKNRIHKEFIKAIVRACLKAV